MTLTTLTKPEAIIFDWDNTLANSAGFIHKVMNLTQEAFDVPLWTYEQAVHHIGASSKSDFFINIFDKNSEEARELFYKNYEDHNEELEPMHGSHDLIEMILQKNIPMAVVSNKRGDLLRDEIKNFKWEHYFLTAVGSKDTEEDKPSALPLIKALKDIKLKASPNIWFVGDGAIDVECAVNGSCLPILFGIEETQKEKLHPKCNHYVANHHELVRIISLY